MKPIKTNKRQLLNDYGPFLKVEQHEVEFPDGTIIPDWPWVITPGFVNVTAVTTAGEFIVFRQTKYAVEGTSLAPVGGYLDEGESALQTAQRELREETGYVAEDWLSLGGFPLDANRGGATGHFFLATNAVYVGPHESDDLEEQELVLLNERALRSALAAGEFKVVSWIACMHMALAAWAGKTD